MRWLASSLFVLGLCLAACDGDSSSPMSVWNDGGPGGAPGAGGGGLAGHGGGGVGGGAGGSGGTLVSGTLSVPGGARDLATAQCTATSGGSCAAPADYLGCLKTSCGGNLIACYVSDGISAAVGGACQKYASCMLACPCNASKSSCENACMNDYWLPNPNCSSCLAALAICGSSYGCVAPTTCSASTQK